MKNRLTLADIYGVGIADAQLAHFVIELSKDHDARRAATASGYAADSGYKLRDKPEVQAALQQILQYRLENSHIDAEWLMWELVDNHQIAKQTGKLTASNTALGTLAKFANIDAFAAEKIEVAGDEAVKARLLRARNRMNNGVANSEEDDQVSFL